MAFLRQHGYDAVLTSGAVETNRNGVTTVHDEAMTDKTDGKVYVADSSVLPARNIAAHEIVHINEIGETEAFSDFQNVVCSNLLWDTDAYKKLANEINQGYFSGRYETGDLDFVNRFVTEISAYINELVVTDPAHARAMFGEAFADWDAVVQASHNFNTAIGADYNSIPDNNLPSTDDGTGRFPVVQNAQPAYPQVTEDPTWSKAERRANLRREVRESAGQYGIDGKTVGAIEFIAERTGTHILFVDSVTMPDGSAASGKFVKGQNLLLISKDAAAPVYEVVKHELTHSIAGTDLYGKLVDFVKGSPQIRHVLDAKGKYFEDLVEAKMAEYATRGEELDYDGAVEEIVAEYVAQYMLTDQASIEALFKAQQNVFYKFLFNIRNWGKNAHLSEDIKLLRQAEQLYVKAMSQKGKKYYKSRFDAQQQTDSQGKYSFNGYADDGKGKYQSNFPKGTPKKAKAQKILEYIQKVWSKKPIRLKLDKNGENRYIYAQFDPTYDSTENIPTDASKLMGGNRHGTASDQRVTLDLADDYYQIATEAKHGSSKDETGKTTAPHEGVRQWHYFVNDIYFAEYGSEEYAPYRITINVKEKTDGHFVYSVSAEKIKGQIAPQTLHAVVNNGENPVANDSPYDSSIAEMPPDVNTQYMQDGGQYSVSTGEDFETAMARLVEQYGRHQVGANPEYELGRIVSVCCFFSKT